jgi:hypothetical protein
MLMLFAWTLIAKTVATGFHRLFDFYNPEQKILHPDANLWMFLLRNSIQLVVIYFILRKFSPGAQHTHSTGEESIEPIPPVKWMRPFHFMTDRMIVFAFAPNLFTTYYFYFKMEMPTGRQFSAESLYLWAVLTTALSSAVCYLITEKLFQVTPSKVLSGTLVTSNAGEKPTWRNVFVRTASRLIPFEPLSFFSERGWHDRFSRTKVSAVNGSLWIHQNARVIRIIFIIGITFFVYALVTLAFQIKDDFFSRDIMFLPMVIGPFIFMYLAITFTCWIATISNFAENAGMNQSGESSSHLVSSLCMWVPLVNFTTNSTMFSNMASNLHAITADYKVDRVIRALNRSFLWMYIFTVICIIMLFVSTSWVEIYVLMTVASIVIVVWITQVLRFTRFVSNTRWIRAMVELDNPPCHIVGNRKSDAGGSPIGSDTE